MILPKKCGIVGVILALFLLCSPVYAEENTQTAIDSDLYRYNYLYQPEHFQFFTVQQNQTSAVFVVIPLIDLPWLNTETLERYMRSWVASGGTSAQETSGLFAIKTYTLSVTMRGNASQRIVDQESKGTDTPLLIPFNPETTETVDINEIMIVNSTEGSISPSKRGYGTRIKLNGNNKASTAVIEITSNDQSTSTVATKALVNEKPIVGFGKDLNNLLVFVPVTVTPKQYDSHTKYRVYVLPPQPIPSVIQTTYLAGISEGCTIISGSGRQYYALTTVPTRRWLDPLKKYPTLKETNVLIRKEVRGQYNPVPHSVGLTHVVPNPWIYNQLTNQFIIPQSDKPYDGKIIDGDGKIVEREKINTVNFNKKRYLLLPPEDQTSTATWFNWYSEGWKTAGTSGIWGSWDIKTPETNPYLLTEDTVASRTYMIPNLTIHVYPVTYQHNHNHKGIALEVESADKQPDSIKYHLKKEKTETRKHTTTLISPSLNASQYLIRSSIPFVFKSHQFENGNYKTATNGASLSLDSAVLPKSNYRISITIYHLNHEGDMIVGPQKTFEIDPECVWGDYVCGETAQTTKPTSAITKPTSAITKPTSAITKPTSAITKPPSGVPTIPSKIINHLYNYTISDLESLMTPQTGDFHGSTLFPLFVLIVICAISFAVTKSPGAPLTILLLTIMLIPTIISNVLMGPLLIVSGLALAWLLTRRFLSN